MALLDTLLARLARRHRRQLLIDALAPRLMATGLIVGVGVACVRLALPALVPLVPAAVAGALLLPLCWVPALLSRQVPRSRLAGELDLLAGTHGTAMALAETPDAAWAAQSAPLLDRVRVPPLRWAPLLPSVAALAVLAGALLLPQAEPPPPDSHPAAALVRPLREELAQLSDAGVITRPEQQEVAKRIDDLLAHAGGALDQATWDGLDRLQAGLDAQAATAGEHLAAALAAAQAGATEPPAADSAQAAAQAAALADRLATSLAALALQAPGLLPGDLKDPASREALAQALAQAQAKGLLSEAQRQALQRAGLTPGKPGSMPSPSAARALARSLAAELAKRRSGLGQCRAATAAEAFLARLNGSCNGSGLGSGSSLGGSPAPSRGPGTAELDRMARARTAGGEQAGLTPGATLNPDGSVTIAAQARDAEPDPAAQQALQRAAVRAFDPTAADSRRAEVAPQHRAVVEAYFANDEVHH